MAASVGGDGPPCCHVGKLWDLAGQDRFVKLTRAYFRKGEEET